MDPSKALNFQTFPNGQHIGTMGPGGPMPHPAHMHSRAGSQSMVRYYSKKYFNVLHSILLNSLEQIVSLARTAKVVKAQSTLQHPNTMIQQIMLRKKINTDVAILMDNL